MAHDTPGSSRASKRTANDVHPDETFKQFCNIYSNLMQSSNKQKTINLFFLNGSDGKGFKGDHLLWCKLLVPLKFIKPSSIFHEKSILSIFSELFKVPLIEMHQYLNDYMDLSETIKHYFINNKYMVPSKFNILTMEDVYRSVIDFDNCISICDAKKHFKALLSKCTPRDLKFVIKILFAVPNMPIEVHDLMNAIHPNALNQLNKTDIETVVQKYCRSLKETVTLFRPIYPVLYENSSSIDSVLKKYSHGSIATITFSGRKVQIHKEGRRVEYYGTDLKPFEKGLETCMKGYINRALPEISLILDAEVILMDKSGCAVHESLSNLSKTHCEYTPYIIIHDCIYCKGEVLIEKSFKYRKDLLKKVVREIPNRIIIGKYDEIKNPEDLGWMINEILKCDHACLIFNDLKSAYTIGIRSALKVKRHHIISTLLKDTISLLVLGAWFSERDRLMSVFLMGCFDKKKRMFVTVCKIHTGLDPLTLERLLSHMDMMKISCDPEKVPNWLHCNRSLIPDFIAKNPKRQPVWEVSGAGFLHDTVHTANGISIKIPRFVKSKDSGSWKAAITLEKFQTYYNEFKRNQSSKTLSKTVDKEMKNDNKANAKKNESKKKEECKDNKSKDKNVKQITSKDVGMSGTNKKKSQQSAPPKRISTSPENSFSAFFRNLDREIEEKAHRKGFFSTKKSTQPAAVAVRNEPAKPPPTSKIKAKKEETTTEADTKNRTSDSDRKCQQAIKYLEEAVLETVEKIKSPNIKPEEIKPKTTPNKPKTPTPPAKNEPSPSTLMKSLIAETSLLTSLPSVPPTSSVNSTTKPSPKSALDLNASRKSCDNSYDELKSILFDTTPPATQASSHVTNLFAEMKIQPHKTNYEHSNPAITTKIQSTKTSFVQPFTHPPSMPSTPVTAARIDRFKSNSDQSFTQSIASTSDGYAKFDKPKTNFQQTYQQPTQIYPDIPATIPRSQSYETNLKDNYIHSKPHFSSASTSYNAYESSILPMQSASISNETITNSSYYTKPFTNAQNQFQSTTYFPVPNYVQDIPTIEPALLEPTLFNTPQVSESLFSQNVPVSFQTSPIKSFDANFLFPQEPSIPQVPTMEPPKPKDVPMIENILLKPATPEPIEEDEELRRRRLAHCSMKPLPSLPKLTDLLGDIEINNDSDSERKKRKPVVRKYSSDESNVGSSLPKKPRIQPFFNSKTFLLAENPTIPVKPKPRAVPKPIPPKPTPVSTVVVDPVPVTSAESKIETPPICTTPIEIPVETTTLFNTEPVVDIEPVIENCETPPRSPQRIPVILADFIKNPECFLSDAPVRKDEPEIKPTASTKEVEPEPSTSTEKFEAIPSTSKEELKFIPNTSIEEFEPRLGLSEKEFEPVPSTSREEFLQRSKSSGDEFNITAKRSEEEVDSSSNIFREEFEPISSTSGDVFEAKPGSCREGFKPIPGGSRDEFEPMPGTSLGEFELMAGTSKEEFEPMPGTSKEVFEPMLETSREVFEPMPGTSKEEFEPMPSTSRQEFELMPGTSKEVFEPMLETSREEFEPMPGTSREEFEPMPSTSRQEFELMPGTSKEVFEPMPGTSREEFEPMPGTSKEVFEPMLETSREEFEPMPGTSREEFEPMPSTSRQKFEPMPGTSKEVFEPMPGTSREEFEPMPGTSKEVFEPMLETSREEFEPMPGTSKEQFEPIPSTSREEFEPVAGTSRDEFEPRSSMFEEEYIHRPGTSAEEFEPIPGTSRDEFESRSNIFEGEFIPRPSTSGEEFISRPSTSRELFETMPGTSREEFKLKPGSSREEFESVPKRSRKQDKPSTSMFEEEFIPRPGTSKEVFESMPGISRKEFEPRSNIFEEEFVPRPSTSREEFDPIPGTSKDEFNCNLSIFRDEFISRSDSFREEFEPMLDTSTEEFISRPSTSKEVFEPKPSTRRYEFIPRLSISRENLEPKPSTSTYEFIPRPSTSKDYFEPRPSTSREEFEAGPSTSKAQFKLRLSSFRGELVSRPSSSREMFEPRPGTSKDEFIPRPLISKGQFILRLRRSRKPFEPRPNLFRQEFIPKPSTSKEEFEPIPTTSRENFEPRPSTSKYEVIFRPSTSKEEFELKSSTSRQEFKSSPSTSREEFEPRPSTSRQESDPIPSTSREEVGNDDEEEILPYPRILVGFIDKPEGLLENYSMKIDSSTDTSQDNRGGFNGNDAILQCSSSRRKITKSRISLDMDSQSSEVPLKANTQSKATSPKKDDMLIDIPDEMIPETSLPENKVDDKPVINSALKDILKILIPDVDVENLTSAEIPPKKNESTSVITHEMPEPFTFIKFLDTVNDPTGRMKKLKRALERCGKIKDFSRDCIPLELMQNVSKWLLPPTSKQIVSQTLPPPLPPPPNPEDNSDLMMLSQVVCSANERDIGAVNSLRNTVPIEDLPNPDALLAGHETIGSFFKGVKLLLDGNAGMAFRDYLELFQKAGGEIVEDNDIGATHMLHVEDTVDLKDYKCSKDVRHVIIEWIIDSISMEKLLDYRPYSVRLKLIVMVSC